MSESGSEQGVTPQRDASPPAVGFPWRGMSDARARRWAWGFVVIGIAIRLSRYLLRYPLWGDENKLAANFITRDFRGLLDPLDSVQIAPVLFLWIEKTAVRWLGFNEYSLRLFPVACSAIGLVLFMKLASSVLRGAALVLAVGVLAVSYYPIRYAVEVKPYASDLTISLLLTWLASGWWSGEARVGRLWWLAALTPAAIGLSFPAAFVLGGVSLALLRPVWLSRSPRAWTAYLAINAAAVATFAAMLVWVYGRQGGRWSGEMDSVWDGAFPPLGRPLHLPAWLALTFSGELLAYPVGAENGGSLATLACLIIGLVVLWRAGRRGLVVTLAGMVALSLAAAAMRRYPFAGSPRFSQHLAPLICLGAGVGAAWLISRLRDPAIRRSTLIALVLVLAALGVGNAARSLTKPYKAPGDFLHRGFARWFWTEEPGRANVCVAGQMRRGFYKSSLQSSYVCNRALFAPALNAPWPGPSDARTPLRCVIYHHDGEPRDDAAFDAWMDEMRQSYALVGQDRYRVRVGSDDATKLVAWYEVYRFDPIPRAGAQHRHTDSD